MITFPGAGEQDNYIVCPYISQAGADVGREYILFIVSTRESPTESIYKYDIERDEFTQIELPVHNTDYFSDSKGKGIGGAIFNESNMAMFTAREDQIVEWGHFDKWYTGDEIESLIEFQAIVGENRHVEKEFKSIRLNPGESTDVTPYVGVNGIPPFTQLTQDVSQDSYWDCSRKLHGYMLHLLLRKTGGAGGKVFTSGVTVEFEEKAPVNRGRSYTASKTEYVNDMWSQGPLLKYGVASTTDGTDETIAHGCSFRPIACFASLKRTGTLGSASELLVTWNGTNIIVNYTGWQSGDELYWLAIMDSASLPKEGWFAEEQIYWRTRAQILDLSRNPGAVLLSRAAAPSNKRVYNSNSAYTSDTRLAIPLAGAVTYPALDYRQLGTAAFYSDLLGNNKLTCGSQTVGNSDTAINHSLGSTPTAVLITSHTSGGAAMPYVRGVSSTQITVRNSSSGRLDWVAFV